jgi:hypothetical protein
VSKFLLLPLPLLPTCLPLRPGRPAAARAGGGWGTACRGC